MQYVLVNNNSVLNGPRNWNFRSFESTLNEELEIEFKLPMIYDSEDIIVIDENTKIYSVRFEPPGYNSITHFLHGPFWDFTSGIAIATYEIHEIPLDQIKNSFKEKVANNRWIKESEGVKVTIQTIEVTVDTSRDNRDIFFQKYLLMGENDVSGWKFPEGWLEITKQELGLIVATGAGWIQTAFDWEKNKAIEIDNCTTVEELLLVDLGDPVLPVLPGG